MAETITKPVIGVLALQGAVELHRPHIEALGCEFRAVKTPDAFEAVDAFILPGGESTTMLRLIDNFGLWDALAENFARKPVWGICAGSILMAETVYYRKSVSVQNSGYERSKAAPLMDPVRASASDEARQRDDREWHTQKSFGLLPITVQRNGYGTQKESHHAVVEGYNVSLIRAPIITHTGEGVEVLASHEGDPVWVKRGHYMASTFHAEVNQSFPSPMHRAFIEIANNN